MEKHFKRISTVCILICSVLLCWGDSVSLVLLKKPTKEHRDESKYGHREPGRPITCIIDLELMEISFSPTIDDVDYYELWDADQSTILYSGEDEHELIETILSTQHDCTLVVVSDSQSYCGTLIF